MTARHLELKIPPVLVTLGFALLIWLSGLWLPGIHIPEVVMLSSVAILVSLGGFIAISGVVSFRRARTTVNPTRPDASSSLVTDGIYRLSRNPMYLGLLFILAAWAFYLSNLYGFVFCLAFVIYMNHFQIHPEERAMQTLYGATYSNYKAQVRRWL